MAEDILTIHNGSEVAQTIYDEQGRRHTIDGFQVLPFPKKIAKLFLAERGRYVQPWQPIHIPAGKPGEAIAYVANVTGNPFLPDMVEHKYLNKQTKLEVTEMVKNPLKVPQPLRRKYHLPQEVIDSPGGTKTTLSHPPVQVSIPPYHRLPVPESCADWLQRRDAQQDEKMVGALVIARAPTGFEPNETWELHEIMVYARMVDDAAQGWVIEKAVWKAIDEQDEIKIAELKIKLLNTLFFRLVDDRWALPSRQAFDAQLQKALEEHTKAPATARRGGTSAAATT